MTRRESLLAAASLAVGAVLPASAAAAGPKLRAVYRWRDGGWVRCRMFELLPFDTFMLGDMPGLFRASSKPYQLGDGMWAIEHITRVDLTEGVAARAVVDDRPGHERVGSDPG